MSGPHLDDDLLLALVEGAEEEGAGAARHVQDCAGCAERLARWKARAAWLSEAAARDLAGAPPPLALGPGGRIRRFPALGLAPVRRLAAAAAILLAAVGAWRLLAGPARVARVERVRSAGGEAPSCREGEAVAAGRRIECRDARVALRSEDGALLAADRRAVLRWIARGRVRLETGRLLVSGAPAGFEVEAPGGVARDLGTSFLVEAGAAGPARVLVLSGRVRLDVPGTPPRTLGAGERAPLAPGGPVERLDPAALDGALAWAAEVSLPVVWEDEPIGRILDQVAGATGLEIDAPERVRAVRVAGSLPGSDADGILEALAAAAGADSRREGNRVRFVGIGGEIEAPRPPPARPPPAPGEWLSRMDAVEAILGRADLAGAALGPALRRDPETRRALFEGFARIAEFGRATGGHQALSARLAALFAARSLDFTDGVVENAARPFVASLRAQAWIAAGECAAPGLAGRRALADSIRLDGPGGRKRRIWEDLGVLVIDNGSLGPAELDAFQALLEAIPADLHRLRYAPALHAFASDPSERVTLMPWDAGKAVIPAGRVGGARETRFPATGPPVFGDRFCLSLAANLGAAVSGARVEADPVLRLRARALLRGAGRDPLQHLASEALERVRIPDYFERQPEEFFPCVSAVCLADTDAALVRACALFDRGNREPLAQFLFFLDVYARGGRTAQVVSIGPEGAIRADGLSLGRDPRGRIRRIFLRVQRYDFDLDPEGRPTGWRRVPTGLDAASHFDVRQAPFLEALRTLQRSTGFSFVAAERAIQAARPVTYPSSPVRAGWVEGVLRDLARQAGVSLRFTSEGAAVLRGE